MKTFFLTGKATQFTVPDSPQPDDNAVDFHGVEAGRDNCLTPRPLYTPITIDDVRQSRASMAGLISPTGLRNGSMTSPMPEENDHFIVVPTAKRGCASGVCELI